MQISPVPPRTIHSLLGPSDPRNRLWIIPGDIRGVLFSYLPETLLDRIERVNQLFPTDFERANQLMGSDAWSWEMRLHPLSDTPHTLTSSDTWNLRAENTASFPVPAEEYQMTQNRLGAYFAPLVGERVTSNF